MHFLIAGATGQIGCHLVQHYREKGHRVSILSRQSKEGFLQWDGKSLGDWTTVINEVDVVINLSDHTVNCRYNSQNRVDVYFSRLDSTRVLGEAIAQASSPPKLWLNASTATIYKHSIDEPQDEHSGVIWDASEPGIPEKWHFSVDVDRRWEAELERANTPRTRKIAFRASLVMEYMPGGVFSVLSSLVRFGLGGFQGNGKQYVSWIHIDDFIASLDWMIEKEEVSGVINVCSPNPLPNKQFMKVLRQAWEFLPLLRCWRLELSL